MNFIIRKLKENPSKSINQISLMLKINSVDVAEAQREYYTPFLKRDSNKWGKQFESVKR